MNDGMIEVFEKELKNKIQQKMVPNQSEDKILMKYFKHFDLDNSGMCKLRDFIRAIEKIGVVLGKIHDLHEVFKHYDKEGSGYLDYKKFSFEIFYSNEKLTTKQLISTSKTTESKNKKIDAYIEKLLNILKPNGGRGLILFYKDFKVLDFNNTSRLNIDDFIKLITETKLQLSTNEIQQLFHRYELNNNGYFFYEELFKDLKSFFHTEKRVKFINEFYTSLINNQGRNLKFSDLKRLFNAASHPLYSEGVSEEELAMEFYDIVDSFQFVSKINKIDALLTKENFIEFFKFFGFGIDNDEVFSHLVSSLFEEKSQDGGEINDLKKNLSESNNKQVQSDYNPVYDKLRKSLQSFGRKSLFALIKHFKYYDNGTKFINKYDFAKVMRDFRLNLTLNEIEQLFEINTQDKRQTLINYDNFIEALTVPFYTHERQLLVSEIYNRLKSLSNTSKVDLNLIKSCYNPRDHPYVKDEIENAAEYFDCIEIFQYNYKLRKSSTVSEEDFNEFYRLMSFLYEEADQFVNILTNEWKKVKKEAKEENKFSEVKSISSNNRPVTPTKSARPTTPLSKGLSQTEKETALAQNTYTKPKIASKSDGIAKLREKLRKRGVRGLMNLHKQFLLNTSDINAISLGDFNKVLKLQRIDIPKDDVEGVFNQFKQNNFLNFSLFIRNFKKVLNDNRLEYVEKAFAALDNERTEMLFVDEIKLRYNAATHPDVVKKRRSEDEVVVEFLDCFELNYNFLAANENPDSSNLVSFEEFANFYEYISFIYENDDDFASVIKGTWNLN